jgi:hypothetical protein
LSESFAVDRASVITIPEEHQMLKVMAFLVKKQGLDTDELIDYYETHHVPLTSIFRDLDLAS